MATQNPLEQEGVYPLPEAQLDRFMFNTYVDYPSDKEIAEIVVKTTGEGLPDVSPVMDRDEILRVQGIIRRVPIADPVVNYLTRLSAATRPGHALAPPFVNDYVNWGCGPRAAQYLALGAKAHAVLHGQPNASIPGVQAVARSVMRHRIALNFNGQAEGLTSTRITHMLLEKIPTSSE
jgi:MoxR-like ATPase